MAASPDADHDCPGTNDALIPQTVFALPAQELVVETHASTPYAAAEAARILAQVQANFAEVDLRIAMGLECI